MNSALHEAALPVEQTDRAQTNSDVIKSTVAPHVNTLSDAEQFRAAMLDAGLIYDGPIVSGKIQRFRTGEDRSPNSWFIFFADAPAAGTFGCWKRSIKEQWHATRKARTYSNAEWAAIR